MRHWYGGDFSAENFEFRSGANKYGDPASFWPKDSRGIPVFDFEVGAAKSELNDVGVGVGLCD